MSEVKKGFKLIQDCKKGDFIKKSPTAKKVYIFDGYNRSIKKYEAYNADDINDFASFTKGKPVFVDFEY